MLEGGISECVDGGNLIDSYDWHDGRRSDVCGGDDDEWEENSAWWAKAACSVPVIPSSRHLYVHMPRA